MRINFDIEEAKAALDKKTLERPDHLMALHPKAKPALLKAWLDWCDEMQHLRTRYEMASSAKKNQWLNENGETPEPLVWNGITDFDNLNARHKEARAAALAKREQEIERKAKEKEVRALEQEEMRVKLERRNARRAEARRKQRESEPKQQRAYLTPEEACKAKYRGGRSRSENPTPKALSDRARRERIKKSKPKERLAACKQNSLV